MYFLPATKKFKQQFRPVLNWLKTVILLHSWRRQKPIQNKQNRQGDGKTLVYILKSSSCKQGKINRDLNHDFPSCSPFRPYIG